MTFGKERPNRSSHPSDVGVAGAQIVQRCVELRTVGAGAGCVIGEDSVAAGFLEGVDLGGRVLVGRRHARISDERRRGGGGGGGRHGHKRSRRCWPAAGLWPGVVTMRVAACRGVSRRSREVARTVR